MYELRINFEPDGDFGASGGCDEYIQRVTVGDIDNTSECVGYSDFTALSTEMTPGLGYPITIVGGNTYSGDDCAIWIDWNQDLWLDQSERVSMDVETGYGPYTGIITPPLDAAPGQTLMRTRLSYFGVAVDMAPYGHTNYGEVEDYSIMVVEASPGYLFDPDPILIVNKYTVDPMIGNLYIGNSAGDIAAWENISMSIAGCEITVGATEILTGGWVDFEGDVLKISFDMKEFIECEELHQGGLLWDVTESFFDVFYDVAGSPGQWSGQVTIIGHRSGDLNLDGEVNVSDLTFLVDFLFKGGPVPQLLAIGDVDGSGGSPNVSDLSYLVDFLFKGGLSSRHP